MTLRRSLKDIANDTIGFPIYDFLLVVNRWRHIAMKCLKQKSNDCVQDIILQKFTNCRAIRSYKYRNICNKTGCPRFFSAPPCTSKLYT